MASGTYFLRSTSFIYVGSSSDFRRRKADHMWRLKNGTNPCAPIQKEFNDGHEVTFQPKLHIPRLDGESDQSFRNRLRAAEQQQIDELKSSPQLANKSPNARGPNNGQLLKDKWKDPEFRQYMAGMLSSRKASDETRAKLASAKTGARNPKSRAVIVTHPDGTTSTFSCGTAAAKFFRVSQQLFHTWITGKAPWPGTGKCNRFKNEWIGPYKAEFVDTTDK